MNGNPVNPARRGFLRGKIARARRRWERDSALTRSTPGVLWDVAVSDDGAILVVGDDGCVLRRGADEWLREDANTDLPLHAVCWVSSNEAIAVGWLGVVCDYRDGAWVQVRSPSVANSDSATSQTPLFGLCVAANSDVWAVGDHGRIVCRHDGQWQEHDSGVTENLRAVIELSDGRILVTGANGIRLIGDHDGWTQCVGDSDATLTGLARAQDDVVYAVGARYDGGAGRFQGVFMRFDGHAWHDLELPPDTGRLRDLAIHGEAIRLVGDSGAALEYVDGWFKRLDVETQHDLHAVVNCANDEVLITGDFDTVLRQQLHTDRPVSPTLPRTSVSPWTLVHTHAGTNTLWGVWSDDKGFVIAVGEAGTVVTLQDGHWQQLPAPTTHRLQAVWGSSASNMFCVGEGGMIIHYDGTAWTHMATPGISETLVAVTGFGPHDVFAVGDGGVVLRFDGLQWQRHSSTTQEALYDVWGTDGNHVLAVGDAGVVLRWNGTRWDSFHAGTDHALYGVWGTGLDNIFLVGPSGTTIRFDGSGWSHERAPSRADLLAVTGCAGRPLAVGTLGAAVSRDPVEWRSEDAGLRRNLRGLWSGADGAFAVGDGGVVLQRRHY